MMSILVRMFIIGIALAVFLLSAAPVAAASIYFDPFPSNTTAENFDLPGVSFNGGGNWDIINSGFTYVYGNRRRLYSAAGNTLTITFANPQTAASFVFATSRAGNIDVTATFIGSNVFAQSFSGAFIGGTFYEGSVAINTWIDTITITATAAVIDVTIDNLLTTPAPNGPGEPCPIEDGRINDDLQLDCAAPIAIYIEDEALKIYGINVGDSTGLLNLNILHSEIDALGIPEDSNIEIATANHVFSGHLILVSRLTTGEIQINTYYADGKPYIVVWHPASPYDLYHLAA